MDLAIHAASKCCPPHLTGVLLTAQESHCTQLYKMATDDWEDEIPGAY